MQVRNGEELGEWCGDGKEESELENIRESKSAGLGDSLVLRYNGSKQGDKKQDSVFLFG